MAIGGWDGKVRVLESEGWRCVGLLSWGARVGDKSVVRPVLVVRIIVNYQAVWREPSDWIKDTRGRGIVQCTSMPLNLRMILTASR